MKSICLTALSFRWWCRCHTVRINTKLCERDLERYLVHYSRHNQMRIWIKQKMKLLKAGRHVDATWKISTQKTCLLLCHVTLNSKFMNICLRLQTPPVLEHQQHYGLEKNYLGVQLLVQGKVNLFASIFDFL